MKKLIVTCFMCLATLATFACPVCERNKPKILQGITHGANAESKWDYVIVFVIGIIAILTLIYSIKWIIKPGEKNTEHIKYTILNEQ